MKKYKVRIELQGVKNIITLSAESETEAKEKACNQIQLPVSCVTGIKEVKEIINA